jgi:hypothetical protein
MSEFEYLDVLEPEVIKPLTNKLRELPTHEGYRQAVEDELWEIIVSDVDSVDSFSIHVADLSPEKQGLIAVQENGEPPWWMRCFNWEFFSERQGTWTVPENAVSGLSGYEIETTIVNKPEYNTTRSGSVFRVLRALDAFQEKFEEYLESANAPLDDEQASDYEMSFPEFPIDNIFQFAKPEVDSERSNIVTTGKFDEWFTFLSSLCPPVEPTLTGLVYAQAGVDMEVIEGEDGSGWVLDPGAVSRLKNIGLYDKSTTANRTYQGSLRQLLKFSSEFDRRLNVESTPAEKHLSPLEMLLYHDWAHRTEATEVIEQLIEYATESYCASVREELNNKEYAEAMVSSPIHGTYNRPTFVSLSRSGGSYGDEGEEVQEIQDVLREAGLYAE